MRRYVMTVEWTEYVHRTGKKLNYKDNYSCTAGTVDEAIQEAKNLYDSDERYGLVVTSIYSEDA